MNGTVSEYDYIYDSMGRLLTVIKDSSLVEEYQYGLNGTRIYEMNTAKGIAGRALTYSDEDRLLTAGTIHFGYNLDGFLSTRTEETDVTSYDYSSNGELLSVTLPDGTLIEYIHDTLGRRIAKKVNCIITEKYLWHGMTSLLAVYDGADNLVMRFEYADGRMPVAMTSAGITYYLTYNQVGSLKLVADSSGNVVKRIDFDSFGNILNDSDPTFSIPFGFAGGLHDKDTGLVKFGYRDYDPEVGRWTAKDPIRFAGGDTDLYGYVLNDPVNLVDPDGQFALSLTAFGTAVVAGASVGAVSSFVGTLVGGGDFEDALASIPTGALSGTLTVIGAAGGLGTGMILGIGVHAINVSQIFADDSNCVE